MAFPMIQIPSEEEVIQAVKGQCDLYYLFVDANRPQLQPMYALSAKMSWPLDVKIGIQQIMAFLHTFPPTVTTTHSMEIQAFADIVRVTVKGQKFFPNKNRTRLFTQYFLFCLDGGEWKIWEDMLDFKS